MQNTQLKKRLCTQNYFSLKVQYLNLKKFESKIFIFKVKIGLSPELMNDILEFVEKQPSLRLNSEFRPDNPNDKI